MSERRMPGEPHSCTVLFVDISGSTRLYEELGDAHALARVASCLRLLQRAAEELAGRVVKTTGDGLMCAFFDADAALQAARAMHVRVVEQTGLGGPALGIHVGCHFGTVIENEGDLYGDCVNAAARVAGLAKVGQILATQEVVGRLAGPARDGVRLLDRVTVRGKREPLEIYEFIWQDTTDDLTMIGTGHPEERVPRLRLAYGERLLWFDGSGAGHLGLGRDAACDIVVAGAKTSRQHARIEKRRDKFVLVDHSSNGTFVAVGAEPEVCLRREELMLRGRGRIGLGHRTADAEATVIEFSCE